MPPVGGASRVPIGAFLAEQGNEDLGSFTGLAIGPNLVAAAVGDNLALDGVPGSGMAYRLTSGPHTEDYTAHPNEFVLVDSTDGPVVITLPNILAAGDVITVKAYRVSPHDITMVASGDESIEGEGSDLMSPAAAKVSRTYVSYPTTTWYITANVT